MYVKLNRKVIFSRLLSGLLVFSILILTACKNEGKTTLEDHKSPGVYEDSSFKRKDPNVVEAAVKIVGGMPRLTIDGKQVDPIMMSIPTLDEVCLRQAELASKYNAPIIRGQIFLTDNAKELERRLDEVVTQISAKAPNAYIMLLFGITMPASEYGGDNFLDNFKNQDGKIYPYNSIADDKWMEKAIERTTLLVETVLANPKYSEKIVSYNPCGSYGGEWFGPNFWDGHYDSSEAAQEKFRSWLKALYKSDDELKKAWGNNDVTLEAATIPKNVPVHNSDDSALPTLLTEPKHQNIADYQIFYSRLMAKRIDEICKAIKDASDNRSLTASYYGYHFEISIATSGCLGLSELLKSPNIDILAAPNSYLDRNEGGIGASMSPVQSVAAAGKVWLDESDYRSPFATADGFGTGEASLGNEGNIASAEMLNEIMYRQYGKNMVSGSGTWWLDLLARGWYDNEAFWAESAKMQALFRNYSAYQQAKAPEIAFIWDESAIAMLGSAWETTDDILRKVKENAPKLGMSYGYYSLDDLLTGKIDNATLFVMYTPWNLNSEQVSVLKSKLHVKGKTTLWMYGYGKTGMEVFKELTGMTVTAQQRSILTDMTMTDSANDSVKGISGQFISGDLLNPRYAVEDDKAKVWGTYDTGGQAAVASYERDGWKSVFYGTTNISNDFFRSIAKYAGIHAYLETEDIFYTDRSLAVIHARKGGEKMVALPYKCDVYDYFSNKWHERVTSVTIEMKQSTTRYLFIGKKADYVAQNIGK